MKHFNTGSYICEAESWCYNPVGHSRREIMKKWLIFCGEFVKILGRWFIRFWCIFIGKLLLSKPSWRGHHVSMSRLTLTWDKSTDNVAIAGYKIFRDGIRIGFSQTNSFEDKTIESAAGYEYQVSAYDTALNESPLSAALGVKTSEPSLM